MFILTHTNTNYVRPRQSVCLSVWPPRSGPLTSANMRETERGAFRSWDWWMWWHRGRTRAHPITILMAPIFSAVDDVMCNRHAAKWFGTQWQSVPKRYTLNDGILYATWRCVLNKCCPVPREREQSRRAAGPGWCKKNGPSLNIPQSPRV